MEVITPNTQPPTFYNTNRFTYGYQLIVEAYGVARYREVRSPFLEASRDLLIKVNPTLFTIVTFPFLFAVMFGDSGHGFLMLLFASLMIIREKQMSKAQLGDMIDMLFGGRYVILLMACFSIYVGFIYNEAFSMPMTVFGDTKWSCSNSTDDHRGYTIFIQDYTDVAPRCGGVEVKDHGEVYIFGLDPIWHGTNTELTFTNSIKMKMSIILGVVHMDLGILMSLFNHQYFKDKLSIWYASDISQISR